MRREACSSLLMIDNVHETAVHRVLIAPAGGIGAAIGTIVYDGGNPCASALALKLVFNYISISCRELI